MIDILLDLSLLGFFVVVFLRIVFFSPLVREKVFLEIRSSQINNGNKSKWKVGKNMVSQCRVLKGSFPWRPFI